MGICGQFLDDITDQQRDRVIEAEDFGDGWEFVAKDNPSCRCLVGHAEDYERCGDIRGQDPAPREITGRMNPQFNTADIQFPELVERFGKDRIVRLCKQRAAKGNRLHEIRAEIYEAQRDAGLVPMGGLSGRVQ